MSHHGYDGGQCDPDNIVYVNRNKNRTNSEILGDLINEYNEAVETINFITSDINGLEKNRVKLFKKLTKLGKSIGIRERKERL